jgi:hypothetical protein
MKTTMLKYLNRIKNMNPGKKLFIVLFSLGLALGASAQRGAGYHGGGGISHGGGYHGGGYHGGGVAFYPRTYVGLGLGFGYPFYPYGGFYGPWGYPYPPYYYGYGAMPSRLGLQIDDIKNDYAAQIRDTKGDKSITRKERREKVNQLKHDRDAAVIQARRDYYYNSRRNNNNQPQPYNGNGQQPSNGNNQQPSNSDGQKQPTSGGSGTNGSEQPEYESSPSQTGTLQQQ